MYCTARRLRSHTKVNKDCRIYFRYKNLLPLNGTCLHHARFFCPGRTPVRIKLIRWLSSGLLRCVVWYKYTDVSEVLTASIIRAIVLLMEAARTSETSGNVYQTTRRKSPENSHLHTRRRKNLKSHNFQQSFCHAVAF
jgi:hypothetical protein